MEDRTRVRFKVGITVAVSIFILIYGISFLKDFRVGISTNDITVYFKDVNGLKVGDQVSVNGVPKGKVKSIELDGDSVRVEFFVEKDVIIKKDYIINVAMIELMSGKQIAISPGTSSELADISKPLIGSRTQDVVTMITSMNEMGDQVKEIMSRIEKVTNDLDNTIKNVNDIVGDENFKSNVRSTASNFNAASKNFSILIEENRKNLSSITSKLNSLANNLDATVTETRPELKTTLGNIKELTVKLDSLGTNLNNFVLGIKDPNSTVGKLLTQDELYKNLNKTLLDIDKLVKKLQKEGLIKIF
jgi:phospholipid/cholesterol/gamma-HCH transport system substrate-binding protein